MTNNPDLTSLGQAPAEWLRHVEAAYLNVDKIVQARGSGTATGQLRSELAQALLRDVDGPYPEGWALSLPAVVHRIIGDAAAWQMQLAHEARKADDELHEQFRRDRERRDAAEEPPARRPRRRWFRREPAQQ